MALPKIESHHNFVDYQIPYKREWTSRNWLGVEIQRRVNGGSIVDVPANWDENIPTELSSIHTIAWLTEFDFTTGDTVEYRHREITWTPDPKDNLPRFDGGRISKGAWSAWSSVTVKGSDNIINCDGTTVTPAQATADADTNRRNGQSTLINITGTIRPDSATTFDAHFEDYVFPFVQNTSNNGLGDAHIMIKHVSGKIRGSQLITGWVDDSANHGGATGKVWKATWNYTFGYRSIKERDQLPMALAQDMLFVNDAWMRPYKTAGDDPVYTGMNLDAINGSAIELDDDVLHSKLAATNWSGFKLRVAESGGDKLYTITGSADLAPGTSITVSESITAAVNDQCTLVHDPGHTVASLYGTENSFFVDEGSSEVFVHLPTAVDPTAVDCEVPTVRGVLRFQGQHNITLKDLDAQHSIDKFNEGSQGLVVFNNNCRNINVDSCTVRWANHWGVKMNGNQDDTPGAGAVYDFRVVNSDISDCGGQGAGAYRTIYQMFDRNYMNRNNWRGDLGNWYRWNVGNKTDQCHKVMMTRNEYVQNLSDGQWFDLDGEDVMKRWNLYKENKRYGTFEEASHGPFILQFNRFIDNGSDPSIVDDGLTREINMNSRIWIGDNVLDGRGGGGDRCFTTTTDPSYNRWHEFQFDADGRFQMANVFIAAVGANTIEVEDADDTYLGMINDAEMHDYLRVSVEQVPETNYHLSGLATKNGTRTVIHTVESVTAAVSDPLTLEINEVPHHIIAERNIVIGYEKIWSWRYTTPANQQQVIDTLSARRNVYDQAGTYWDHKQTEFDSQDFDSYRAYLLSRGVGLDNETFTKVIDLSGVTSDLSAPNWWVALLAELEPALAAPQNVAVDAAGNLTWDDGDVTNVDEYEYYLDSNADPSTAGDVYAAFGLGLKDLTTESEFAYNTQLYVKIRALNKYDDTPGPWSAVVPFAITPPVAVDDDAESGTANANITVGSPALVVAITADTSGSDSVSGVTIGGQAMTLAARGRQNFQSEASIWYINNAPQGSQALAITTSDPDIVWRAFELNQNVDLGATLGVGYGSGNSAIADQLTPQAAGSVVIDIVARGGLETLSVTGGQVSLFQQRNVDTHGSAYVETEDTSALDLNWSSAGGSNGWGHAVAEFKIKAATPISFQVEDDTETRESNDGNDISVGSPCLVVAISADAGANDSVIAVSIDGLAMALATRSRRNHQCEASIWYLNNAPQGSRPLNVTSSKQWVARVFEISDNIVPGATLTAEYGTGNSSISDSMTPQAAGSIIIDLVARGVLETLFGDSAQVNVISQGNVDTHGSGHLVTTGTSAINLDWSTDNNNNNNGWAHAAVELKPLNAGGPQQLGLVDDSDHGTSNSLVSIASTTKGIVVVVGSDRSGKDPEVAAVKLGNLNLTRVEISARDYNTEVSHWHINSNALAGDKLLEIDSQTSIMFRVYQFDAEIVAGTIVTSQWGSGIKTFTNEIEASEPGGIIIDSIVKSVATTFTESGDQQSVVNTDNTDTLATGRLEATGSTQDIGWTSQDGANGSAQLAVEYKLAGTS